MPRKRQSHAETLRERLRPLFAETGQSEVSRRSGVPQPSISAWLAGTRPMRLDSIARVAEAVGMELSISLRPR